MWVLTSLENRKSIYEPEASEPADKGLSVPFSILVSILADPND